MTAAHGAVTVCFCVSSLFLRVFVLIINYNLLIL